MHMFRVRISDACSHFDEISVIIDSPRPKQSFLPGITPTPGGFLVRFTPLETGQYLVRVLLNSCHIYGSPFPVEVLPIPILPEEEEVAEQLEALFTEEEQMANSVRAFGPGLRTTALVNHIAEFIVDLKPVTASHGSSASSKVQVIVDGPCETKIHCKDNHDNTCSVAFMPNQVGAYEVSVLYNGYHIDESPFAIQIIEGQELEIASNRSPILKPTASFRRR